MSMFHLAFLCVYTYGVLAVHDLVSESILLNLQLVEMTDIIKFRNLVESDHYPAFRMLCQALDQDQTDPKFAEKIYQKLFEKAKSIRASMADANRPTFYNLLMIPTDHDHVTAQTFDNPWIESNFENFLTIPNDENFLMTPNNDNPVIISTDENDLTTPADDNHLMTLTDDNPETSTKEGLETGLPDINQDSAINREASFDDVIGWLGQVFQRYCHSSNKHSLSPSDHEDGILPFLSIFLQYLDIPSVSSSNVVDLMFILGGNPDSDNLFVATFKKRQHEKLFPEHFFPRWLKCRKDATASAHADRVLHLYAKCTDWCTAVIPSCDSADLIIMLRVIAHSLLERPIDADPAPAHDLICDLLRKSISIARWSGIDDHSVKYPLNVAALLTMATLSDADASLLTMMKTIRKGFGAASTDGEIVFSSAIRKKMPKHLRNENQLVSLAVYEDPVLEKEHQTNSGGYTYRQRSNISKLRFEYIRLLLKQSPELVKAIAYCSTTYTDIPKIFTTVAEQLAIHDLIYEYHHDWAIAKDQADGVSSVQPESDEECGICLDPCTTRLLPGCDHIFHRHCIKRALRRGGNCPLCRTLVQGTVGCKDCSSTGQAGVYRYYRNCGVCRKQICKKHVVKTSCGHVFHPDCVEHARLRAEMPTCPTCNTSLPMTEVAELLQNILDAEMDMSGTLGKLLQVQGGQDDSTDHKTSLMWLVWFLPLLFVLLLLTLAYFRHRRRS